MFRKFQYILYSLMYIVLSLLTIKGIIIIASELMNKFDYSLLFFLGIALFALVMFIIALINCIKKIIN